MTVRKILFGSKPDVGRYLEYLDKEMTIMGILSAVSLAASAGILKTVLEAKSGAAADIWNRGCLFVVAGSVSGVLAAVAFYMQRSTLAWYYGQICLTEPLEDARQVPRKLRQLLSGANSWEAWWLYSWGTTALTFSFLGYLAAFVEFFLYRVNTWRTPTAFENVLLLDAIGLTFIVIALQRHVLVTYKDEDRYWICFWNELIKPRQSSLPHDDVYTRLKRSSTSGVGVFAIVSIPKNAPIFGPDNAPTVKVPKATVDGLDPAIRRLYEDFCVLQEGIYECPDNFNNLTISWFVNDSKHPNIAPDSSLRFSALRNISVGEELTSDYSTYSQNETPTPAQNL